MPLLLTKRSAHKTSLAAWKITEENDFFLERLNLSSGEVQAYEKMRAHRQREWLSSRYLLHLISGDDKRRKIEKRADGKPFRVQCNRHISISHSGNLVAAVISERFVGVDIQNYVEKIARIQHKFISPEEKSAIPDGEELEYYLSLIHI